MNFKASSFLLLICIFGCNFCNSSELDEYKALQKVNIPSDYYFITYSHYVIKLKGGDIVSDVKSCTYGMPKQTHDSVFRTLLFTQTVSLNPTKELDVIAGMFSTWTLTDSEKERTNNYTIKLIERGASGFSINFDILKIKNQVHWMSGKVLESINVPVKVMTLNIESNQKDFTSEFYIVLFKDLESVKQHLKKSSISYQDKAFQDYYHINK